MSNTWQIGEVRVTKILEVELQMDPGHLVPAATPEIVLAHDWTLGPFANPETGELRVSIHTFAIEMGDEMVSVTVTEE